MAAPCCYNRASGPNERSQGLNEHQCAAEYGVFGDRDVYGAAVCQGGGVGDADGLLVDVGVCGDLLELARLDLI